jgi:RNA polymerase sigma-70 factor, ECF subfamily
LRIGPPKRAIDAEFCYNVLTGVMGAEGEPVTILLKAMRDGDQEAMEKLVPLVYAELHRLAAGFMRRERPDHTLQPTALINEAFLRLTKGDAPEWQSRSQFIGVAAHIMRRVLVDHARSHKAGVRGGDRKKLPLEEGILASADQAEEIVALSDALDELAKENPRQAKVVEMRFFGGLSIEEIAALLGIAPRSVKRDWAMARVWLHDQLSRSP